jgi:hypothetical protein
MKELTGKEFSGKDTQEPAAPAPELVREKRSYSKPLLKCYGKLRSVVGSDIQYGRPYSGGESPGN